MWIRNEDGDHDRDGVKEYEDTGDNDRSAHERCTGTGLGFGSCRGRAVVNIPVRGVLLVRGRGAEAGAVVEGHHLTVRTCAKARAEVVQ